MRATSPADGHQGRHGRGHPSAAVLGAAALLVTALVGWLGGAARAASSPAPRFEVVGVHAPSEGQVSLVLVASPSSPAPMAVRVIAGDEEVLTRVEPVLSTRSAVALVLDASADGETALRAGGLAGAANFLLQLPAGALTAVIADRRPPEVLSPPSLGVSDDLQATSTLRGAGERATGQALDLAVEQVPSAPAATPLVVLYTCGTAVNGVLPEALAERLRRSGAVVAVVGPGADQEYWSTVAHSTGGVAVGGGAEQGLPAFDRVADALRRRSVVSFPRPDGVDRVGLRISAGGQTTMVEIDLPRAHNGSGARPDGVPGTTGRSAGPVGGWVGLMTVIAGGMVIAVVVIRRRRLAPAGATPPASSVSPSAAGPPLPAEPLIPRDPPLLRAGPAAPPSPRPSVEASRPTVDEASATGPTDGELRQEVQALEDRIAREPTDTELRRDLARAYQRLAARDLDQDRVALAAAGFRRAVDALAVRVALDPSDAASRRDLLAAVTQLAYLDADQGWIAHALAGYRRAIEIGEWLVRAAPAHAGDRRALDMARTRLAGLERDALGKRRQP